MGGVDKMDQAVAAYRTITHYNKGMGGVDKMDQAVAAYRTRMRQRQWWWPIFAYLLDVSVSNAWLLMRKICPNSNLASSLLVFRRSIAVDLLVTDGKPSSKGILNMCKLCSLPVQTCKERWKNIRTVFLRHLRKKPPSGSAGGIKKKYYLADALHFLIPFVKTSRKQKGNLNLDCELNQSISDSDDDDAGSKVQESQEIDPEVQVTNTQPQLDETESPEPPRVSQSIHNRFTAIKTKNKQTDAEKSPLSKRKINRQMQRNPWWNTLRQKKHVLISQVKVRMRNSCSACCLI
ncbi:Transposase IS4 [Popillia japonica]|uniref:Transposase IS4 n=1 Tax=Popillia japonica TaxID=7064 RepID=A0AAW1ICY2_POPJA